MKKIIELLVCFLHPVAVVLIWANLLQRKDISGLSKILWAVFVVIPFVPFVYVLLSGDLW